MTKMKKIIRYTLASALLSLCGTASAQNLNSAYFLDGFAYGHQLNPAKEYDRKGYFSVPILPGNLNVGVRGNLGLQDLLMKNPNGNGLVTFLHPALTDAQALKGIKDDNKFLTDIRYDIFSLGFHALRSYHTITLGIRANVGVNFPGDMLMMVRNLENKNYEFSNMGATGKAWAELGYGYSRNVTDAIRVGGKFKFLLGVGYANLQMDKLNLNLENENKWTANATATAEVGVKGFTWGETETKEYSDAYKQAHPGKPGTYEQIDFDNIDVDKPGIGGKGASFDLGVEWDLDKQGFVPGLKFSAAVVDMGFIKWSNVAVARNKGEAFVFDGFQNIKVSDGQGVDLEDQVDDLGDRLNDLISLQPGAYEEKSSRAIGATMNMGLEYTMPFYKRMSAGFLFTKHFQDVYSWNEERLSLTISPLKAIEASASLGFGTFGTNFGWIINFHPRAVSLFIGGDYTLGSLSKQFIPLRSNANISMGINFPLGKSRM